MAPSLRSMQTQGRSSNRNFLNGNGQHRKPWIEMTLQPLKTTPRLPCALVSSALRWSRTLHLLPQRLLGLHLWHRRPRQRQPQALKGRQGLASSLQRMSSALQQVAKKRRNIRSPAMVPQRTRRVGWQAKERRPLTCTGAEPLAVALVELLPPPLPLVMVGCSLQALGTSATSHLQRKRVALASASSHRPRQREMQDLLAFLLQQDVITIGRVAVNRVAAAVSEVWKLLIGPHGEDVPRRHLRASTEASTATSMHCGSIVGISRLRSIA
mmetsp:Transcript_19720/g.35012  ORF Transcript_19720/g.35012 Transcript_19720/m.35012 type:complete len:269 (-) Transcript_19720:1787-2593(-)